METSRHCRGLRCIPEETTENRIFPSTSRVPDGRLRHPAAAPDYSPLSICPRSIHKSTPVSFPRFLDVASNCITRRAIQHSADIPIDMIELPFSRQISLISALYFIPILFISFIHFVRLYFRKIIFVLKIIPPVFINMMMFGLYAITKQ